MKKKYNPSTMGIKDQISNFLTSVEAELAGSICKSERVHGTKHNPTTKEDAAWKVAI